MKKLKWWEHPTYFLNNFEVKDPVGYDQRLSITKLSEILWRRDQGELGFKRIQLLAHRIDSLTEKEIDEFMEMNGLGRTIGNKQLIEGYLKGEVIEHFPWWLMMELLNKGILPPVFSTERVILKNKKKD